MLGLLLAIVACLPLTTNAGNTVVSIKKNQFYINGELTYKGRYWEGNKIEGLLMNSRMVNGIFDDANPKTRDGFKYPDTGVWDPERNTTEFVSQMEQWHAHGLLAFTLNMQGGSPMGYGNKGWINSAFEKDGKLKADYLLRLQKVLDRADELGMVVILGYFYFGADQFLTDEKAVIRATRDMTQWLLDKEYENVIIEIANECDIHYEHAILNPARISELITMVRSMTKNGRSLLAGTSFSGIKVPTRNVAEVSDFLLIHGNGAKTPTVLRNFMAKVKDLVKDLPAMPILINEDDHFDFDKADYNLKASIEEYISWGLFDFRKKGEAFVNGYQSIPASWGIDSDRKKGFFGKLKEITAWGTAPTTFHNPILPGYHPDPSICKVGDEYYMVNSSFEWWPCMPIHKSKDLVNWELVGYGKVDPAKLPIKEGTRDAGGIFAVTIRHHDGLFYLITTMVGGGGNFYITAEDPTGEWSDPVWLHSMGIDPSLFWDDNGKCYYVGHGNPKEPKYAGNTLVWVQELDLKQGKLVGKQVELAQGVAVNASYPEGPHIYKHEGKYVLVLAEGGTGMAHSVMQFVSDDIFGPYVPNKINPILTHRHLGADHHFQSIGHADIVQTQNNEWWMVALGTRNFDGKSYLARETFLTPMEWESFEGTLGIVVNRGHGKVLERQNRPNLPWSPVAKTPARDEFSGTKLALQWNLLRSPMEKWYDIKDGKVALNLRPQTASEFANPSLCAQRIKDIVFTIATRMDFNTKKNNEEAGLILYRDSKHHVTFTKKGNKLVLMLKEGDTPKVLAEVDAPKGELVLQAKADGENLSFFYGAVDQPLKKMDATTPLMAIGNQRENQFNGPMVGIYATSNGQKSRSKVAFDWFDHY